MILSININEVDSFRIILNQFLALNILSNVKYPLKAMV